MKILITLLALLLFGCDQTQKPEKPFIVHHKAFNTLDTLIINYGVYDANGKYLYFQGRIKDYRIGDTIP